ncbi:MAG: HAD-IA family hydrolase [Treponema sp.]|nr:HAD-IA family hydrolase [Treponema sp.]
MIKYLLFDLDNTLYSRNYGLEYNVSCRIMEFTAAFLGITPAEAKQQRKATIRQYGTSLEWLLMKGLTDVEAYFAAVHPKNEADSLPRDPQLRAFLLGIPIPKAILTNSPREHADLILDKLGISDIFTHIFDIRQCGFRGKPHRDFFDHALQTLGVDIADVLFIDDYPIYVEGFLAIGGNGILLDENNKHQNYPSPKIRELKEIVNFLPFSHAKTQRRRDRQDNK